MFTCIYIHTYICIYVLYVYIYIYVYVYVYVYVYIYVYIYIYTYVYIHVYIYIHMYIYYLYVQLSTRYFRDFQKSGLYKLHIQSQLTFLECLHAAAPPVLLCRLKSHFLSPSSPPASVFLLRASAAHSLAGNAHEHINLRVGVFAGMREIVCMCLQIAER